MLHLNKKLVLLFFACCTPYAFAAEMPEAKEVEDEENKANSIKVENYTLKHSKKKVNNDVDDFEDIEEEVQDEVESIANKVKDNAIIACIIVSNSPALPMKKGSNIVEKTTIDHDKGGQATYKRYVIGNYRNTGIIAKQGHKLAHKLGYHIIQTTPSHIGLSLCQFLAYNKQVNKLFYITTNKTICTKCHYILTKIIGYNKKIEHKEDGCDKKELPWPIPAAAANYINEYILKYKRPLQVTESILKEFASKNDAINILKKEKEALELEMEAKDDVINNLKKEKADVEKALKESRGLVQTILEQKKEVEQKVEEMKHEAEEKVLQLLSVHGLQQLAANEALFQQELKDKKCNDGDWYKENIPKDLASIRKVYPLIQQGAHKQAALAISYGLATVPDYEELDFYVKVQYWSCKLYDLQKKVTPPAAKKLLCSLSWYLEEDAKAWCPYHGKKVSPLPAPTSSVKNPNWKARLAYAQKGWAHHNAKSNNAWGLVWYKKWIQKEMEGLQQAYPKLQAKQHKKEALDLFIALSEIHRFEHFAFLFQYMKVQKCLLELTGRVGHMVKDDIVYTKSMFPLHPLKLDR